HSVPADRAVTAANVPSGEAVAAAPEAAKREQLPEDAAQRPRAFDEEGARTAIDEAMQQKRAAETAVAELRQSLQREQEKTAVLEREAKVAQATTAAGEVQRRALDEAQARAAALASELAATVHESEARVGQSQRAADEAM